METLARSEYGAGIIERLRAAELSKNVCLMEMVRRAVVSTGSEESIAVIDSARGVLDAAQGSRPGVVAALLASPNFGYWAYECLTRLRGVVTDVDGRIQPMSLSTDLGHLANFAAVAALRAAVPCSLELSIRDGVVSLPTLGHAVVSPWEDAHHAHFTSDGDSVIIRFGAWQLGLSITDGLDVIGTSSDWTAVPRMTVRSQGLNLSVLLDDADPFLSQLAPSPLALSSELIIKQWESRLTEAWQLLTRHNRLVAIGLAEGLTTLVPSSEVETGRPITATCGWAWGAIILSLPSNGRSCAEALTHEFHHLALAAAEDVAPLFDGTHDDLCYAPWRDDPRPRSTLLQGAYAFMGVTGLWLHQLHVGSPAERDIAAVEFARRRENIAEVLDELGDGAGFTHTGRLFVAQMANSVDEWLAEPVPQPAETTARQLNAEHRQRWLRTYGSRSSAMVPGPR